MKTQTNFIISFYLLSIALIAFSCGGSGTPETGSQCFIYNQSSVTIGAGEGFTSYNIGSFGTIPEGNYYTSIERSGNFTVENLNLVLNGQDEFIDIFRTIGPRDQISISGLTRPYMSGTESIKIKILNTLQQVVCEINFQITIKEDELVDGRIYGIKENGDLLLYKHNGDQANWSISAQSIGNGWDFKHVFAGTDGRIYGIKENGDLLLYKHSGDQANWSISAQSIGNGWDFKHVFAGTDGRIYGIKENGDLLLYKHSGDQANWSISAQPMGNGWDFKHVFAGTDGRIYGIKENGDLLLYKHSGDQANWSISAQPIGNGWDFKHVFAGTDGRIYGIKENGDLLLYKHSGDQANWSISAQPMGNGWDFKHVFAGK